MTLAFIEKQQTVAVTIVIMQSYWYKSFQMWLIFVTFKKPKRLNLKTDNNVLWQNGLILSSK